MDRKGNKAQANSIVDVEKATIWVTAISEDYMDQLSDWEKEFILSVYEWIIEKGGKPSVKQYETLEKIYRKFY